MPRLSSTYPVQAWRGREIIITAQITSEMFAAVLSDDPKARVLHVTSEHIEMGDQAKHSKVTRLHIINELQAYESVLYSVWSGEEASDAVTDAMERIIALVQTS